MSPTEHKPYSGRFAPSPTGPLHFGSLIAALASFLDARQQQGLWRLRIEDLDPPREMPRAADRILRALEQHGLEWDGEVTYQSHHVERYTDVLEQWQKDHLVYPCTCTRRDIASMGGRYNGHCRHTPPTDTQAAAWRIKTGQLPDSFASISPEVTFTDRCLGPQYERVDKTVGDFILRRKDGLFAYQLAVVVDDIDEGITDIVRGADLLSSTGRQLYLYQLLGKPAPRYAHVPLVLGPDGQKLSKQNFAPQLDPTEAGKNLFQALVFLGQCPPAELAGESLNALLDWGIANWALQRVPKQTQAYQAKH